MADILKLVIIGGVAGGATAAARARRLSETAQIVLIERGEHISFANCGMPYYIGGVIADRNDLLVQTAAGMKRRYGIDVRTATEALTIDRANKSVHLRDLRSGREYDEPYDALILSPGAAPIRPEIPGADHPLVFTLRNLSDMDAIRAAIDQRKPGRAIVIGGGYIGLEMAEALRQRDVAVALVEVGGQVFTAIDPEMAAPLHQQLLLHGVELHLGNSAVAIEGNGEGVRVKLKDGTSLEGGLAIMAIGVRPEAALATRAGLAVGQRGGIVVDEHMRTSDASIFAIGDAIEVSHLVGGQKAQLPLAGPANRQGRIAADNVFGRPSAYRNTQGTAICKVFDVAVGITGLSGKAARQLGLACEKVYVHAASHAGYYPGASPLSLKLLFDPAGGKVLGAQAVGAEGVDKRIDVIATAIRAGMTVYDLEHLELSYAPPYGSAKDPINYAGFVAANVLRGDVALCQVADVQAPRADQLILDVRTAGEVKAGAIPNASNVPVDELRGRLGELPKDKELLVYCQVGLRGYLACRILQQNGFRCRNLSGGYKTYRMFTTGGMDASGPAVKSGSAAAVAASATTGPAPRLVDCCGLSCPGPITRMQEELDAAAEGEAVRVLASDPGFPADVAAWCRSTGNQLADLAQEGKCWKATVVKRSAAAPTHEDAQSQDINMKKNKTVVVFSNDYDRVMAALVIANGAAAMGNKVTMFFTFWGLNVLRRPQGAKVNKSLVHTMFGWMMPRGPAKLGLSKLNMAGMGKQMLTGIMKKLNVPGVAEMLETARAAGVRLVACRMSMDVMGIAKQELIDGVDEGGVAVYLEAAEQGNVNLFI